MTDDEIDAACVAAHTPGHFIESGTFAYDRLIFRAGMEAAAKVCDKFAAPRLNNAKWAAEQCAAKIREAAFVQKDK